MILSLYKNWKLFGSLSMMKTKFTNISLFIRGQRCLSDKKFHIYKLASILLQLHARIPENITLKK